MKKEAKSTPGMSLIVKTIAGSIQGLIFLFGIYVVISGSTMPGGAFPGGVIISFSFILIIFSHGREAGLRKLKNRQTTILTCIGILIFLSAAMAGLFIADCFFKNLTSPDMSPHTSLIGSYMFLYEIAIALLVSMSLLLVFSMIACSRLNNGDKK